LGSAFPAFVGRQVRTAYELMSRALGDDHGVFMTLSGAMTPAGLHSSCIVPLIERGCVDVLTTTGANLYHDAHRVIGHAVQEIDPNYGDRELRESRTIRIYDLAFSEDVLLDTDQLFMRLLAHPELQRTLTTPELHNHLGKQLHAIEQEVGAERPCLLSACYQAGVPIFVGAPQDGSILLNAAKLRATDPSFTMNLDVLADINWMAALQWMVQRERDTAIWILGGGVPKNYTLQGEPALSQMYDLDARGFDIDVQFCVDPVDNGALSSCPAGEGHTWGKVTADFQTSSVYVHCDVTAVFPWLVHALMHDGHERPQRRLMDRMPEALESLERDIAAQKG
jgi:deoxyhypusine synthase